MIPNDTVASEVIKNLTMGGVTKVARVEVLVPPAGDSEVGEAAAFRARKRLDGREDLYVASLSFRTVVYKALCAADQLAPFYADLRNPSFEVRFGVFHQRFSTNTEPSWERTQPFRLLCHNGEINAIRGNVNWMRARALTLGVDGPVLEEASSDSGMLDNALELLVRGGRDARHALTMLIPPAWQGDAELDPAGYLELIGAQDLRELAASSG